MSVPQRLPPQFLRWQSGAAGLSLKINHDTMVDAGEVVPITGTSRPEGTPLGLTRRIATTMMGCVLHYVHDDAGYLAGSPGIPTDS
jgi:hypothetical protein